MHKYIPKLKIPDAPKKKAKVDLNIKTRTRFIFPGTMKYNIIPIDEIKLIINLNNTFLIL